jgi:hypothetical protein
MEVITLPNGRVKKWTRKAKGVLFAVAIWLSAFTHPVSVSSSSTLSLKDLDLSVHRVLLTPPGLSRCSLPAQCIDILLARCRKRDLLLRTEGTACESDGLLTRLVAHSVR